MSLAPRKAFDWSETILVRVTNYSSAPTPYMSNDKIAFISMEILMTWSRGMGWEVAACSNLAKRLLMSPRRSSIFLEKSTNIVTTLVSKTGLLAKILFLPCSPHYPNCQCSSQYSKLP